MKLLAMADRKDKPPGPAPSGASRKAESAFDLWLRRGLHQLYDEVANEPIPPEILRLIEDHKKKA
jgi:hypothetical protein